jgi:hypothetical protein
MLPTVRFSKRTKLGMFNLVKKIGPEIVNYLSINNSSGSVRS